MNSFINYYIINTINGETKMNIIKRLKNWFKKEEPKEEYYIDFRKLRQRELEQEFNSLNNVMDLRFASGMIPYLWSFHNLANRKIPRL